MPDNATSPTEPLARRIAVTVNGEARTCHVQPRTHLVDFLREDLDLTGSHLGCEHGVCGACTVRVDGRIVRGCLVLAVQADGAEVQTVEGLTRSGAMRDLQDAFIARNALQCGYCTAGMLMAAAELIETRPEATREEVRAWMSGNYCRCTGYQAIVDAVCGVLAARLASRATERASATSEAAVDAGGSGPVPSILAADPAIDRRSAP